MYAYFTYVHGCRYAYVGQTYGVYCTYYINVISLHTLLTRTYSMHNVSIYGILYLYPEFLNIVY